MNKIHIFTLVNSAMKLLQIVQTEIDTKQLDKSFWIELGMVYREFQMMQERGELPSGDKQSEGESSQI